MKRTHPTSMNARQKCERIKDARTRADRVVVAFFRRCNASTAAAAAGCSRSQLEAAGESSNALQTAAPNTSNTLKLYFKRLHIARLLLRAVLQRVRFAPRPSRPLTRAAATELHTDYQLISPLAHPV
jgi:hypothetical protein